MELADVVAVNKADGDRVAAARRAATEYRSALRLLHPGDALWQPPVLTCSSTDETGLTGVWETVIRHRAALVISGMLDEKRRAQQLRWMWTLIEERLHASFRDDDVVNKALGGVEAAVEAGRIFPPEAAQMLLAAFRA
ncbi:MAG: LAO/AO transport system kinase [Myxococcota bacterium]|jgi:LAO/AO transport system kinase